MATVPFAAKQCAFQYGMLQRNSMCGNSAYFYQKPFLAIKLYCNNVGWLQINPNAMSINVAIWVIATQFVIAYTVDRNVLFRGNKHGYCNQTEKLLPEPLLLATVVIK